MEPNSLSDHEMSTKTNLLLTTSSYRQFSLAEITEATNNFDRKSQMFIGSGFVYAVYLANISYFDVDYKSESSLAYVKCFGDYYLDPFLREVTVVLKTEVHPNLMSLIGYCIESGKKILVYKYMKNGRLEDNIGKADKIWSWKMRVKICLQVAYGLQHLHRPTTEFPFGIAHGHFTTSSILLNENLDAKISNFNHSNVAETSLSDKNARDVYKFGIILIQVLCWNLEYNGPDFNDYYYKDLDFEELLETKNALESTDELSPDSLKALSNALSKCSEPDHRKRPTVDVVVLDLEAALKFQELFHSSSGMGSSSSSSSSLFYSCRQFPWEEIERATGYFDVGSCIGKGGEGTVYRGKIFLTDELKKYTVAVKHLENGSTLEFEKEIAIVAKFRHPNIVSLFGYSNKLDQKALIYEYMGNGSLADYVKLSSEICLSWKQRVSICLNAAKGLQFLHKETEESPKGIIHRDVKPENILIDENWVAKVSDFGMLKLSEVAQTNSTLFSNVKGTRGYFAPESLFSRKLSRKVDVYSFGLVMFEVICRKKRWEIDEDVSIYVEDGDDIRSLARANIDSEIKHEIADKSQQVFIDIIAESMEYDPKHRPTMDKVVLKLEEALKCQEQSED